MIEIERKFLVKASDYREESRSQLRILQGFLSTDPDRTIRVRCIGTRGFLTIKGRSYDAGTSRPEWEYEIPLVEAEELLALCEAHPVEKVRYQVEAGPHIFEVDEFTGLNQGLILAEVELTAASESFIKPAWLGREVTGDIRYYNSHLSLNPFTQWKE
ncbi:MAG: CYTH domain-containing protein [Robiginitalea sp.]|jgi:adenylate cyclase|uniref:CYTH domain-containing protein n=1 Tax=Robiginitalea sp. TaxID=1902411 RepID=UPI003C7742BB